MHRLFTGKLRVDRLTIAIANLPVKLSGTKLVQLSDFHYDGLRLSDTLLAEAIAATNQAKPDLILLTGDYITDESEAIHSLVEQLKNLQSRVGIYAVLGNHDSHFPEAEIEIIQALTNVGIKVLYNQVVYPLGPELALIGLVDFWSQEFNPNDVITLVNQEIPRIVLSHNPDSADQLQQWRVDLQLSGHTHGGQIVIPKLGPLSAWIDPIRRMIPQGLRKMIPYLFIGEKIMKHWEWASGLHQIGDHLLYVNRGLGTYYPGRLFCPPEVTIITLESKSET
jgi:predicted MPP superfamily phosphohydrolase